MTNPLATPPLHGAAAAPRAAPIMTLRDVCVDLPLYNHSSRSLRRQLLNLAVGGRLSRRGDDLVVIRALDHVSFDVQHGDRIGLLGHNGSGKSTLLKVLARIYEPTGGVLRTSLRVTPLLDAGLGVDDEMTGFEAMRVGCMLHGVPGSKMDDATKDITDFTELGDYLHLPIRTYSMGMRARLIFGIATINNPEALAIDEGIGAGDARFIEKARQRAERFMREVGVFFMASHSEDMLKLFCEKGLVLRAGRLEFFGTMDEAVKFYNHGNY